MNTCQHGTCQTVNGTQACVCDSGFTGSSCETSLTPCDLDPCQDHGKCINTEDGFICQCNPWWQGKSQSLLECNNIGKSGLEISFTIIQ